LFFKQVFETTPTAATEKECNINIGKNINDKLLQGEVTRGWNISDKELQQGRKVPWIGAIF
jgi:hypothetical protein